MTAISMNYPLEEVKETKDGEGWNMHPAQPLMLS